MATITMLQMVADYAKKDYISCSANKKHKNMTKLIVHVLSYEENYIRSAFREILTFLSISPLHLHRVGRTCCSHFGRPVHPGMRKMMCMPYQSCCSCILTRWRILSLCSLPQGISTMPGTNYELWKVCPMAYVRNSPTDSTRCTTTLVCSMAFGVNGHWNYLHEVWSWTEWDNWNNSETGNSENLGLQLAYLPWHHRRLEQDER